MEGDTTRRRVAVVDDDENLCRSFARLLRAAGYVPTTYPSAEAFLADTNHPSFDCLVLDVQLPGLSGLELQRELLGQGGATPIVFITAYDNPGAREQACEAGCAAYLRKADAASEVLETIRRVVNTRSPAA